MKTCDWCGFGAGDSDMVCGNCGRVLGSSRSLPNSLDTSAKEATQAPQDSVRNGVHGTKRIVRAITWAVVLIGLLFLILSFHIVVDVPLIIAKDNLSFKDTFVSVGQCIDRWNEADILERIKLSQTNLYRALERRELIHRGGPENTRPTDSDRTNDTNSLFQQGHFSTSDIKIIQSYTAWEDGRLRLKGLIKNTSSVPLAAVVQAVVYDKQGRLLDSEEWYPASIGSIPAGSTWPVGYTVSRNPAAERVSFKVIRVFQW